MTNYSILQEDEAALKDISMECITKGEYTQLDALAALKKTQ